MNIKRVSDSYLYKTTGYGETIFSYIMSSDRVDKNSESFSDIVYSVKKQSSSVLMKVLLSNRVVLLIGKGTSKAFKVWYDRDPKDDNRDRKKVFIDCTGIINFSNGEYSCTKIKTLVSYLTTAMIYVIYYNNPKAIALNTTVTKTGTEAFVDMMLYVMGYLKIPVSYADNKERMSFVIAEYYQCCVLGLDNGELVYNMAKNVSKIKDKKTCDYLHTLFSFLFNQEDCDIDKFLKKFAEVFLEQKDDGSTASDGRMKLTIDAFAQRWMYAYDPGTVFGLECFVPFSQILTNCYHGNYLNQQNTIEKVVGSATVTKFTNELFKIGSENA